MSKPAIRTLTGMVQKDAISAVEIQVATDPDNGGKILIYVSGNPHLFYQGKDYPRQYRALLLSLDWYDEVLDWS